MTPFTKRWLLLALVGIVLTPIMFSQMGYLELLQKMAPDKPFEEKSASSVDDAGTRLAALDQKTTSTYQSMLVRDIPFFLSMGLASTSLLMLAWGPGYRLKTYLLVLTFTVGFVGLEFVEFSMLSRWLNGPGPTESSVRALAIVTPLKFASLGLTIPVLIIGLVLRFRRSRKQTDEVATHA